jgi:hypothetical protein
MDFILVPGALTASETRYALAIRNTISADFGNFFLPLEAPAEICLIDPSELNWSVVLQEQAFTTGDGLWVSSFRVDE